MAQFYTFLSLEPILNFQWVKAHWDIHFGSTTSFFRNNRIDDNAVTERQP